MVEEEDFRVTKEKAKEMVIKRPDNKVHTFYNNPNFGLIGADHDYKSVMKDIDRSYVCKRTGPEAQKMNHGLAIVPNKDCDHSDILFVETGEQPPELQEVPR